MKFKYMVRGLGLGIIITAAVLGAHNRNAVADARVAVLKEYNLGEENSAVETNTTAEESSAVETTEPVIMRDDEKESEIQSVLDAAKEAEHGADTSSSNTEGSEEQGLETQGAEGQDSEEQSSGAQNSDAEPIEQDTSEQGSTAIVVVPTEDEADSGETVEIVIESGDDSGTVSRKLHNAGIIENASEYDAFLMQHGYDKKLSTGTKVIGINDTWQEIADKISRRS